MIINWIETKSPDWKIATIDDNGVSYKDVSVNRTNKKGETFPNFDDLQAGREVTDATIWTSGTGKHYLFTKDKPTPGVMGSKPNWAGGGGVKAAQERKEAMILKAQDRKEESIAYFNALNSAISLVKGNFPMDTEEDIKALKDNVLYWRDFFFHEWSKFDPEKNTEPF